MLATVVTTDGVVAQSSLPTAKTDLASKTAGSVIAVTVNVKNSLGNTPNAGEVTGVHVFAGLAKVGIDGTNLDDDDGFVSATTVGATTHYYVTSGTPMSVEITATVVGPVGSVSSDPLTLTFTGDADAIEVNAVNSPIAQKGGESYATVTATDASGNAAALNEAVGEDDVNAKVKDADGNDVSVDKIGVEVAQGPAAGKDFRKGTTDDGTTDDVDESESDCNGVNGDVGCDSKALRVVVTTTAAGATPGNYTLEVTLGENDPVTTDIIVAGNPAKVELTTDQAEGSSIVTITATVTDEGGHLVPDSAGTVSFVSYGTLDLAPLDGASMGMTTRPIDDGVASTRYAIVEDSGTATVIATVNKPAVARRPSSPASATLTA